MDLTARLKQHEQKTYRKSFTSNADDWGLFWHADNLDYQIARKIEAHIKRMKSKIYIQNLKKHPDIFNQLVIKYS